MKLSNIVLFHCDFYTFHHQYSYKLTSIFVIAERTQKFSGKNSAISRIINIFVIKEINEWDFFSVIKIELYFCLKTPWKRILIFVYLFCISRQATLQAELIAFIIYLFKCYLCVHRRLYIAPSVLCFMHVWRIAHFPFLFCFTKRFYRNIYRLGARAYTYILTHVFNT